MSDTKIRKGLYAGSFDPITLGHLDIVKKALETFDVVRIACALNPGKKRFFTLEFSHSLMVASLRETFEANPAKFQKSEPDYIAKLYAGEATVLLDGRLEVGLFGAGTTIVQYAHKIGATHLVRGLRQISDFDDEFKMHGIIEHVAPDLTMAHFISKSEFLHVSSSTARMLAGFDSDVSWLVTPIVERAFKTYPNGDGR